MLSVYDNSITMAFQIVFSSLLLLLLFAVAARSFNNLQRIWNSPELESPTTRSTNTQTHFVECTIPNGCWMNYIKVHLVLLWYFILRSIVSVSEMDLELFTWQNGDCNERARNHSIFHFGCGGGCSAICSARAFYRAFSSKLRKSKIINIEIVCTSRHCQFGLVVVQHGVVALHLHTGY